MRTFEAAGFVVAALSLAVAVPGAWVSISEANAARQKAQDAQREAVAAVQMADAAQQQAEHLRAMVDELRRREASERRPSIAIVGSSYEIGGGQAYVVLTLDNANRRAPGEVWITQKTEVLGVRASVPAAPTCTAKPAGQALHLVADPYRVRLKPALLDRSNTLAVAGGSRKIVFNGSICYATDEGLQQQSYCYTISGKRRRLCATVPEPVKEPVAS